ncbi:MAG TPA: TPM domain-containing protein [Candidatus Limnocylindrales bacterium]
MNVKWRLRFSGLLVAAFATLLLLPAIVLAQPPAGPPYPQPETNVRVYDNADILSPATEQQAEQIILGIQNRTGAQVVVYTQYKPGSTDDSTDQDAIDLINQWGVGRKGYDDGLAIMWNTTRQQCLSGVSGNGHVRLYAAPGYQATYLSNKERQDIFDNVMLPYLQQCDADNALLAALAKIDAAATPEHANALATARLVDAAVGLIGAPLILLLLVGWAAESWLRYGKDPVYLDDPSILMPAPPPDLTAASAAVVWEGHATRRALTTAMLDLASRGELSFKPEETAFGLHTKTGIQMQTPATDNPQVALNRRRPLSDAEDYALDRLQGIAEGPTGYIAPDDMLLFGKYTQKFNDRIEAHVATKGWFREPPTKAINRWAGRGTLAIIGGVITLVIGFNLPSGGIELLGGALVVAGVIMILIARAMPARTMAGAMIFAMLAAYRRTLQKTMEQARSMNQVVQNAGLSWIQTPDQATVWGVALGLQQDVEAVIARSAEDARQGVSTYNPWLPLWYGTGFSTGGGPGGGQWGVAPGLMSSSVVPDFGGMFSVLGSIGNSPSSSGSGGAGGFGGGGGGGGGGGAGGGY